ncbi:MAG: DNA mismatch repair protein MutS [Alphaproteobacteria bacterium]
MSQKPTPMIAQFLALKEEYAEYLLFYRMGDFYELFFEDAVKAAPVMDINLTKRGKHLGEDVAMCGIPAHSYEPYLHKLIRHGFKVAICEQMETPAEAKKRSGKALVRRDAVRIVTPGTLTEDALLNARQHNYLLAVVPDKKNKGWAISWLDISTGDFFCQSATEKALEMVLSRLEPQEILTPDTLLSTPAFAAWKKEVTPYPASRFHIETARDSLYKFYEVKTLDSFGSFSQAEITAAGALLAYVELTQKGKTPRLKPLKHIQENASMQIDPATRRNLELMYTLSGQKQGSLLNLIDQTVTNAGARRLMQHLAAPLTNADKINARLDNIDFFLRAPSLIGEVRDLLKRCPDIERALSRLGIGRGSPRDLGNLRDALMVALDLNLIFGSLSTKTFPSGIQKIFENLQPPSHIVDTLERALTFELPFLARDGGFIAPRYAPHLDELRILRDESTSLINALRDKYSRETGINTLKIKRNNVIGYHIDVTPAHADKMVEPFIHRQTLGNSVRFTTVELAELETKVNQAADQALMVEMTLFEELIQTVMREVEKILEVARALSMLDLSSSLAHLANTQNLCRPKLDQNGTAFDIKLGRHPVVEAALEQGQKFIANECSLNSAQKIWLITGPNMAGKSTFLRQNALIAILAQMGCYVPASAARIGIIDKVFSRVGASDDLASGRSTFMVEMVETASILHQATEKSLVILDEIGRGTATFDGLSIAWAVVEHLSKKNQCRTLFATHYHEMTELENQLDNVSCHTVQIKEWEENIIFLYKVIKGASDRSYGIHVAKLAGLPQSVIGRANQILDTLTKEQDKTAPLEGLPLFEEHVTLQFNEDVEKLKELKDILSDIEPDDLTPKKALDLLYTLKKNV